MKKILFILSTTTVVFTSMAQNLPFYGVLPAWNQTGRVNAKLNYNFFTSTTIDAFKQTVNNIHYPATDLQLYIQPSLIYVFSPNLNFSVSYTYQRNNPFNRMISVNPFSSTYSNEHRLWQQVIFSLPVSKGRLNNRFRFEERFIQQKVNGMVTDNYPLSTRLRYQVGFNMPLQGKTLDKHEFYLNMYNEFYFSLTGAKNAIYSENWTYAGLGYDIGGMGRVELGYLFQAFVRNPQKDLRFLNLAQVMWITNFNPKRK